MIGLIKPGLFFTAFYLAWQAGIPQVMFAIAGLVFLAIGNVLLHVIQLIAG